MLLAPRRWLCASLLLLVPLSAAFADEPATQTPAATAEDPKKPDPLVVPEEPKTVDPTSIIPELVAKKGTVKFESASLLDVAQWLRDEMQIPVIFEQQTIGYSLEFGATINDRLANAPVYQLLDRLGQHKLSWHVEDGVVYLVGQAEAYRRMVTTSYNLSDLLDAGYDPEAISRTIESTIRGAWGTNSKEGETGSLVWLGDVLFVRQTRDLHREVLGLLQSLRQHGRRTFIYDPVEHVALREKLETRITVDYDKVPLDQVIRELAEQHGVDLRFDQWAIDKHGNSLRSPVSLQLTNQKLQTVLKGLLRDFRLTFVIQHGLIAIMPNEDADKQYKTATYYVSDLCQSKEETYALMQAIYQQTAGDAIWARNDNHYDFGVIVFARVGTMVIRQREPAHELISNLLENYRTALRQSKRRQIPGTDPKEVITRYYRMHTVMADSLTQILPALIESDSWVAGGKPDAVGTITPVASAPGADENADAYVIQPHSVLIIKHRREVHREIEKIIYRVNFGDEESSSGNFGGQQGGFGQGFF